MSSSKLSKNKFYKNIENNSTKMQSKQSENEGNKRQKIKKNMIIILLGTVIGFINGLFGGGGGMIAIPLLCFVLNMQNKIAHASALGIMLPLSIASGISYICTQPIDWLTVLYVTIGSVVGGTMGAFALKKIKSKWLTKLFALVMAGAGIKLLLF